MWQIGRLSDNKGVEKVKQKLEEHYNMKTMNEVDHILSIKVKSVMEDIYILQKHIQVKYSRILVYRTTSQDLLEETECIVAWYSVDNWQLLTYSIYFYGKLKETNKKW